MARSLIVWLKGKKEPEFCKGSIDTNSRVIKVEGDDGSITGYIPFENIDRIEVEEKGEITSFDRFDPLWTTDD